MNEIVELVEKRERFGGGSAYRDSRAINRHSVRVFEYKGRKYTLDRTLDSVPPFYTLTRQPESGFGIGVTVKVNGRDSWGEGWSWSRAVANALHAIREDNP